MRSSSVLWADHGYNNIVTAHSTTSLSTAAADLFDLVATIALTLVSVTNSSFPDIATSPESVTTNEDTGLTTDEKIEFMVV
ncbi:unnamed protein product [Phytophthora lilii]|uniref:Unnamed protein product n=1 Tax=Phytophthora lilii TaxID=2077276 RepID=A0A9W6U8S0_9STRA|nr:unnamed protein product [Phytophthora lilii]